MGKARKPSKDLSDSIFLVVFATLLIQFFLAYPSFTRPFYQGNFSWLHVILRVGAPTLLMAFFLPFGWRNLGLQWPSLPKKAWIIILGLLALTTLAVMSTKFLPDYVGYYQHMQRGHPWDAFQRFGVFTLSTLIPWEILHRGFLLFGLFYLLKDHKDLQWVLPICIVAVFEVAFHFTKPYPEALGLLIASPIFSYIGLKSGSLLVPLLIHLWIEVVFAATMIF